MESRPEKSILILLTNSFAAINLIHSGLLKELAGRFNVQLSSGLIGTQEIEYLNKHFDMKVGLRHIAFSKPSRLAWLLRCVQKLAFAQHFKIETAFIKIAESGAVGRLVSKLLKRTNSGVLSLFLLKTCRRWLLKTSVNARLGKELAENFDGIISTSPLDFRENQIVNSIAAFGVGSLAMIISWDNLTSKGVMNADHDIVLVWNQLMADEFTRFYRIYKVRSKVIAAGNPRFDIYFKSEGRLAAQRLRSSLNIRENEKVILFTTGSPKHFEDQGYIVQDLLDYCAEHPQTVLWIKCHPSDCSSHYEQFADKQKVKIWHDDDCGGHFSKWLPPAHFLDLLSALLHSCEVCIQAASTIRIDAAACNKPVISIQYDRKPGTPYRKSICRLYNYSHQFQLNASGINKVVRDRNSLFATLDELLARPPDSYDYTALIQPFTYFIEPKAVSTTVKHIEEWLG